MKRLWSWISAALATALIVYSCSLAPPAQAQAAPVLDFTAQTQTGNGTVTPALTWSTTPAGVASCVASGDWTGNKGSSGTETLAPISSSKTYNLTCTWPGSTSVTLTWVAPTTNTNGTPYTDPGGYRIYFGTSAASLAQTRTIANPATLTDTITALAAGQWFFAMTAFNQLNVESARTNTVSKILAAAASQQKSVGITVNPVPMPPTNFAVQ